MTSTAYKALRSLTSKAFGFIGAAIVEGGKGTKKARYERLCVYSLVAIGSASAEYCRIISRIFYEKILNRKKKS